jgi:hypothetical protein
MEPRSDGKDKGKNQVRDILITETAIKRGATRATRNSNLRKVVVELGDAPPPKRREAATKSSWPFQF